MWYIQTSSPVLWVSQVNPCHWVSLISIYFNLFQFISIYFFILYYFISFLLFYFISFYFISFNLFSCHFNLSYFILFYFFYFILFNLISIYITFVSLERSDFALYHALTQSNSAYGMCGRAEQCTSILALGVTLCHIRHALRHAELPYIWEGLTYHFILFYFISFYFIVFYFNSSYFILFYFISFYITCLSKQRSDFALCHALSHRVTLHEQYMSLCASSRRVTIYMGRAD